LASPVPAQSPPAPPERIKASPSIVLPEGTVLASGHVLGGLTTIPPMQGEVIVRFEDNSTEIWSVDVGQGETRVFRAGNVLVAKAEYVARERDGKPSCFVYQMHIAPEWLGMPGTNATTGRPDYGAVDDKVYSFREASCP